MGTEDQKRRPDQGDETSGKSLGEKNSQQAAIEGYFQKVETDGQGTIDRLLKWVAEQELAGTKTVIVQDQRVPLAEYKRKLSAIQTKTAPTLLWPKPPKPYWYPPTKN